MRGRDVLEACPSSSVSLLLLEGVEVLFFLEMLEVVAIVMKLTVKKKKNLTSTTNWRSVKEMNHNLRKESSIDGDKPTGTGENLGCNTTCSG